MKIVRILFLFFVFSCSFISCSKKEMKISRADKTIVTELIDQSPIYINKNADGTISVNEKNRIGNTDWIFSIESSLPIGEILPDVQRLLKRKYEKGMHSDEKKAYFIYIDTILKQTAYLPIDQFDFIYQKSNDSNELSFSKDVSVEKFIQQMVQTTTTDTLKKKMPIYIY